jgi:two-component system OmpR family response regulator
MPRVGFAAELDDPKGAGTMKNDCTPKEYALLCHMAIHPDKVFSREELLQEIWGTAYTGSRRTVDTHIKELRKKIERAGFEDAHIVTVWRKGYRFTLH